MQVNLLFWIHLLAALPRLVGLDLCDCRVTDQGLQQGVAALAALTRLQLARSW